MGCPSSKSRINFRVTLVPEVQVLGSTSATEMAAIARMSQPYLWLLRYPDRLSEEDWEPMNLESLKICSFSADCTTVCPAPGRLSKGRCLTRCE